MDKSERRRTMVYSNVNKKAEKNSASKNDLINLDDEIVIGLTRLPEPKGIDKKKKKEKNQTNQNKIKKNKQKPKENIENKQKIKSNQINGQAKKKEQLMNIQQRIKMQKRRAVRKMAAVIVLIILLIGGFVYFLLSPIFNVKTIEVFNNSNVGIEQIINSSGIVLNENMFKFSKREVKNKILTNPYIEEAKITRKLFSNTVQIEVKERNATLMLEYGNSYVYINNQGYILEISPIKLDEPILKGYKTSLEEVKPGNRLNKEDLERLEIVLNIIETANANGLGDLITQIDIQNKKDYKIILESEDKTIYLGDCSDLSTQMLYIKEMIQREKGVEGEFFVNMDLNTGNPVFREKV